MGFVTRRAIHLLKHPHIETSYRATVTGGVQFLPSKSLPRIETSTCRAYIEALLTLY